MNVASDKANHGAIYMGDGTMLHHPYGRLSECVVYGGYWLRHTALLLRHASLPAPAAEVAVKAAA
jgi:cell wall-associated NlpC family hydrolase